MFMVERLLSLTLHCCRSGKQDQRVRSPLFLYSRNSTVITPDTQFTWQAGTDSNARILIRSDISNFESPPAGFNCESINDDGFCQLSPLDFYCDVQDEGSTKIPTHYFRL